MPKTILFYFFFSCLFTTSLFGQTWLDLGAKALVGTSFVTGQNISKDDRLQISPGFNQGLGGKLGINFGENHAVTIDFWSITSRHSFLQSEISGFENDIFRFDVNQSSLGFGALYRLTREASYLEIGPFFNVNRNNSYSDEHAFLAPISDTDDLYRKNMFYGVFGFGGHFIGNEIISLMTGLRFSYPINGIFNDSSQGNKFPFYNYTDINKAYPLRPITIQFIVELNWSLGYFVRASCGKRTSFITF